MNFLLLLLLATCAIGIGAIAPSNGNPEKEIKSNDASDQVATNSEEQQNFQETTDNKKVAKRSYAWNPWSYIGSSHGWPWYGSGLSYGWYPGWPFFYSHGHGYGGYIGYRGFGGHGWYGGW